MGVGVLRSRNKTVVLKAGPSGGLHGHPDKLSISIHDGETEILPDLGTTAYGVPDCYAWYQKTISHNTVTVDKKIRKQLLEKYYYLNLMMWVERFRRQ